MVAVEEAEEEAAVTLKAEPLRETITTAVRQQEALETLDSEIPASHSHAIHTDQMRAEEEAGATIKVVAEETTISHAMHIKGSSHMTTGTETPTAVVDKAEEDTVVDIAMMIVATTEMDPSQTSLS